jgi:hypothetical protein
MKHKFLILSLLSLLCIQKLSSSDDVNAMQLIPAPKKVVWNNERFNLNKCKEIYLSDSTLLTELKVSLNDNIEGKKIKVKSSSLPKKNYILIMIDAVSAPFYFDEAYELKVKNNKIVLKANTKNGIFNGLQTLSQLIDKDQVTGCEILDYPAFKWRGFMADVGRNYQSVEQIKEQIDVMAKYKMNIFHFHATENEAWRFEIEQYPQLTSAESMTRNRGKFYSTEEIKDLIKYCADRYISFVPELDMPGHSAAFTRAMGFDMQSEEGLKAITNLLTEVCLTYPELKYFHIGADEVKVTNEYFIPTVEKTLKNFGKKVISWNPSVSKSKDNIQQLWKLVDLKPQSQYIDSRYLYISDLESQSSVAGVFNREFMDSKHGDNQKLGAEMCMWNDRIVGDQKELVSINSVYPLMLTFAERSWAGGDGTEGYNYFIGNEGSTQADNFVEFEKRLLTHKERYFKDKPFSYVKQTHIKWKLFGPYPNNGELTRSLLPENEGIESANLSGDIKATGGTLWLWHTWFAEDNVKAWLPNPEENTTWYACTRFWSDKDMVMSFWIDFKNQSRSGADATPPAGEWDYNKSKIWLNGRLIDPPTWKFPGRPSGLLNEPLVDESYLFREPHRLQVKKGWNKVLVKLPVGLWDPNKDWQVPPKYMFTFIPIEKDYEGVNYKSLDLEFNP